MLPCITDKITYTKFTSMHSIFYNTHNIGTAEVDEQGGGVANEACELPEHAGEAPRHGIVQPWCYEYR